MKYYAYFYNAKFCYDECFFEETDLRIAKYRATTKSLDKRAFEFVGEFDKVYCLGADMRWTRAYSTMGCGQETLIKRTQKLRADWSRR